MTTDSNANDYEAQLQQKVISLRQTLKANTLPEIEIFKSEPEHYRMRAEFRVWHDQGALYYVMFDQQTKERYRVDQFPVASAAINRVMPLLIQQLQGNDVLAKKLFQVDFLSTLSGEMLVSLLYHRQLDEQWQAQAKALKSFFEQRGIPLDLIGRARKQKIVLDRDFVIEKLHVDQQVFTYQQVENSFTQPNAKIAEQMLSWARSCTADSQGDLLELYCGNGNFSIALAGNFRRVLATEIAKTSVASAQYNIAANQVDNVDIIRMSAEEFTQALNGVRTFRRLAGINLDDYQCNTILVDPPRAGLDAETLKLVQQYPYILYISCNPVTLAANLQSISQTHRIERCALFDQFPFTQHIETGVWLVRRDL
ncbi:MAG: tRNA (uridine(54)-C5)-methyltransferase TrmA [Proteobacteria bacterium]|nr:MAG: tRNA (uridine(54)-C5)-methyltransferase TrmA [Pseudomonadota bacterium]